MNIFKALYNLVFDSNEGWYGKKDNRVPFHKVSSPAAVQPIQAPSTVIPQPLPTSHFLTSLPIVPSSYACTGIIDATGLSGNFGGVTGLIGPLSAQGATGFPSIFATGISAGSFANVFNKFSFAGATGISTGPRISEDEWENPEKITKHEAIRYEVKGVLHCAFGPALTYLRSKDKSFFREEEGWYIKGNQLTKIQVDEIKEILVDLKKAPLYLSHDIFKYAAKYVLKNTV